MIDNYGFSVIEQGGPSLITMVGVQGEWLRQLYNLSTVLHMAAMFCSAICWEQTAGAKSKGCVFANLLRRTCSKGSQKMQPVPPPVFIATKGQPVIHRSST